MKRVGYALIAAVVFSMTVSVVSIADNKLVSEAERCKGITDKAELAGRGCCSWHGGVCGCSGGRAMCCDGMPSPTCGCKADTPTPEGALVKPLPFDNAQ